MNKLGMRSAFLGDGDFCYVSFAVLLGVTSPALAGYKIVLKDGWVIEAKSKPISMEGLLHFSTLDGQFQTLKIERVDLSATQSANRPSPHQSESWVLTNEDLSAGSAELPKISPTTAPKFSGSTSPSQVKRPQGTTNPSEA